MMLVYRAHGSTSMPLVLVPQTRIPFPVSLGLLPLVLSYSCPPCCVVGGRRVSRGADRVVIAANIDNFTPGGTVARTLSNTSRISFPSSE